MIGTDSVSPHFPAYFQNVGSAAEFGGNSLKKLVFDKYLSNCRSVGTYVHGYLDGEKNLELFLKEFETHGTYFF